MRAGGPGGGVRRRGSRLARCLDHRERPAPCVSCDSCRGWRTPTRDRGHCIDDHAARVRHQYCLAVTAAKLERCTSCGGCSAGWLVPPFTAAASTVDLAVDRLYLVVCRHDGVV